jgi:hypothetical protein
MIAQTPKPASALKSMTAWMLVIFAFALVGISLVADLNGESPADAFVITHWSMEGLRVYLWLEGGLLAVLVIALGTNSISAGMTVARGGIARLFGIPVRTHSLVPRQIGYIFVVLGAGLVALSLTTLALLNTCRYMRLI